MKKLSLTLLFAALVSCATSPTGRNRLILVGDQQINQMGAASFQQLKSDETVSTNRRANRYVQCISTAIINQLPNNWRQTPWEVVVFEDKSANAFALPGGKIGVNTGLLSVAETADQLATVIGHEVAHVMSKHGAERVSIQMAAQTGLQVVDIMSRQHIEGSQERQMLMTGLGLGTQVGVLLPFSRTHESEADEVGLKLMAMAGFDPRASITLWENMSKAHGSQRAPEFLATHPNPSNRIKRLSGLMQAAINTQQQAEARGLNPQCRY